jgi:hypothetical protein
MGILFIILNIYIFHILKSELFKLNSSKNVKAIKNIKDNMNSKREQE